MRKHANLNAGHKIKEPFRTRTNGKKPYFPALFRRKGRLA
jgi:hypothetical protein